MTTKNYNEQDIIALVTEYYHLVILLCYIPADTIEFPPPLGREIDEELCHSLQLTPEVISLMRHLPCPQYEGIMLGFELFVPDSYANSFINTRLVRAGRDPEYGTRLDYLKPTDIALTIMGDEGSFLVLDTSKSNIFLFRPTSKSHVPRLTHLRHAPYLRVPRFT